MASIHISTKMYLRLVIGDLYLQPDRHRREALYREWYGTDDGETFSVGVECVVLRVVGLRVSPE